MADFKKISKRKCHTFLQKEVRKNLQSMSPVCILVLQKFETKATPYSGNYCVVISIRYRWKVLTV